MSPTKKKPVSRRNSYQMYEKAVRLTYRKKYGQARTVLLKVLQSFPEEKEFLARIRVFLKVCDAHLRDDVWKPQTPEELFDQGVFQHNAQHYEKAVGCFHQALNQSKGQNDHIYYAIAATEECIGNTESALENLEKAIQLNEKNRFFARGDPDFREVANDDRFQKLVNPPVNVP